MTVRTLGVEEELLLVDPATCRPVEASEAVLRVARDARRGRGPERERVDRELLRHQVELRTEPCQELAEAREQLVAARRVLGEAARAEGAAVVASGTSPYDVGEGAPSPRDRYRTIVDTFGPIGRQAGSCGMHVHVAVASDAEAVAVVDRVQPWLPLLLALSANSPYDGGRDTGYASWRRQVWDRWPSAGPTEPFGSVTAYREAVRRLVDLGAALDPGMVYFDARPAEEHPTVELRVADVCTDPRDGLVVAALARALVETVAEEAAGGRPLRAWRLEHLRGAHWRAARHGLAGTLADPRDGRLLPAREVLERVVEDLGPALREAGDLDWVTEGVERLLGGSGASRQRAAYERAGSVDAVVADLVARTEATWQQA